VSYQGPYTAEDALYCFLADSNYGLNAAITAYRTARGLSATTLPALQQIHRWWDPGTQITTTTPALMMVWESMTGETGVNSRMYDHGFGLALLLVGADVGELPGETPEGPVIRACAQYAEILADLFRRRTPEGQQGWTLADGTGSLAEGRVIRATLDSLELRSMSGDGTFPNQLLLGRVTIRLALDY